MALKMSLCVKTVASDLKSNSSRVNDQYQSLEQHNFYFSQFFRRHAMDFTTL